MNSNERPHLDPASNATENSAASPAAGMDCPSGSTLTKADIIERVYRTCQVSSRREATEVVESVLGQICNCIARGENVKISGFGTFHVRNKSKRIGRNPMTGSSAIISARKAVLFSASPLIKKIINTPSTD